MWARTFSRPRCAIPMTTSCAPASAARSIASSSIGTRTSSPSIENCFWPRNVRWRNCSRPSVWTSLLEQLLLLVRRERRAVVTGLDRLPQPDALLVVRDVLDLVGHRSAVGLAQVREDLGERVTGDVDAQDRGRDLLHDLRGEAEALRLEGGIPDGLGAERVEMRGEMAVRPERLDERRAGGDGGEERPRPAGRWARLPGRMRARVPVRPRSGQAPRPRSRRAPSRRSPGAAAAGARGPGASRRARCRRFRRAAAIPPGPRPDSRGTGRAGAGRSPSSVRRLRAKSLMLL